MIIVNVDKDGSIASIAKQLGELSGKAPTVMVNAINATGRNVTTMLKKHIRQTYTFHRSDKFKEAFKEPKKASKTDMSYTINTTARPPHLTDFKVTPKEAPAAFPNHTAVKVQVLKKGSMKTIGTKPLDAFIARFSNGKAAVVQRDPGGTYTRGTQQRKAKWGEHADMTRLKAFFGPRITSMVRKVYEDNDIQQETHRLLQENIKKQIDATIARSKK